MEKQERFRNFACISYLTEEQLKMFLEHYKNDINHYAYARHDKDENEPHFHVILLWYNNMTISALRKRFSKFSNQNTLAQPLLNKSGAFEYLTHTDEKSKEEGKFQYDKSIIKTDNEDFWNYAIYEEDTEEDISIQIVCDMLAGTPLSVMHKRYGRDFVINYSKYREFVYALQNEERANRMPKLVDEDGCIVK